METVGSGGDDDEKNIISLCPLHHDLTKVGPITRAELHAIMTELYGYQYVREDRG
jgi:hypothetical protein